MRILILGGTGLISTALTRVLVERGDRVVHFNRGRTPPRHGSAVETIQGDRTDFPAFEAQMASVEPFDCVVDMIGYRRAEAESAVRAFRGRTGQYVFCSTVDVYRKPAGRYPITEAEPRFNDNWDYARCKIECEDVVLAAHARGDLAATVIRPAYTYGEGGRIIHSFGGGSAYLDRLRKGKPIVVHGDGNSLWSCCHIDDVARAMVAATLSPAARGACYHVTGDEWLSWNQYHLQMAEALGAPPPTLVHIPTDLLARIAPERARICALNFQFNNIFDNTAARRDLAFRYTIPWREGAARAAAWLHEQGRIEDSDQDPYDDRILALWRRLETEITAAAPGA